MICSVFSRQYSNCICNITYDNYSFSSNTFTLFYNNCCISTFYNVDKSDIEFLDDRIYISV